MVPEFFRKHNIYLIFVEAYTVIDVVFFQCALIVIVEIISEQLQIRYIITVIFKTIIIIVALRILKRSIRFAIFILIL